MIGSLRGTVLDRVPGATSGELLIEAGGVGYRVAVPTGTLAVATVGAGFFVHVHTHVREDAIVLYGFATREERACFEALLGVHGVGPAMALALLSTHGPAALQRIVITEDADALTLVPGVGRKTAVRLLLELRAKLDVVDVPVSLAGAGADPLADVRAALAGLGYGADEVRDALRNLPLSRSGSASSGSASGSPSDSASAEPAELLRLALKQLAATR